MIWNDKPIRTAGDLFDAAVACKTKAEAAEFLTAYRAENEHADANLGYIIGYGDEDTRKRLYELFEVGHPIFGGAV